MSPLPPRGSPPLQSGVQNQKWPINGQGGYVTPPASGIPSASVPGANSEVAHKWARWLRHPCRLGGSPLQSGGQNQKWPINGQGGYVTPPASGIPSASGRGANQKWPINGQGGYITPAASGIPEASERGAKSEVAHLWARWLHHPGRLGDPIRFQVRGAKSEVAHKWARCLFHPCRLGDPLRFGRGAKSEVAHKWARWLRHPSRLGDPLRFSAGGKFRSGP